jgi:uncharacterized protein (TIGR04255 family)
MRAKSKTVLNKPPILEALFEMHWELAPVPNTQIRRDVSYPLLYGRLYDRFKKEYEFVEDLPSVQAHPDAHPYIVRHRMRKAKDQWPILQVGPGIITVNVAKGTYAWDRFREEIVRIFEAFVDFYPASTFPLNILKTELRFINGVEVGGEEDPLTFLSRYMRTNIELNSELFVPGQIELPVQALTLNVGFKIQNPVGNALLVLGSGALEEKPALIQQLLMQSVGENAPQDLGSLDPWLDSIHGLAKHWFETLYQGELMKQFA